MQVKAIVHEDEDGGFWAEVPALPGCATLSEMMDESLANLRETIEGYLTVDIEEPLPAQRDRVLDIVQWRRREGAGRSMQCGLAWPKQAGARASAIGRSPSPAPLLRQYKIMFPNAIRAVGEIMPDYVGADSVPALLDIGHDDVTGYFRQA